MSSKEFRSYFEQRPHYQVTSNQALYENEKTGVYFTFDHQSESEAAEEVEESAGVSFNVNYVRPHVFGLEAEPEVAALVGHFSLDVEDPQLDGMGRGVYRSESFLAGYDQGNRFGYRVALKSGQPLLSLPTSEIERCWRWNRRVPILEQELDEEDVFVPRIMFRVEAGAVLTLAVWPDAIPIALPRVDRLVIGRDKLAPRNFLGLRKKTSSLVSYDEFVGQLFQFPHERRPSDGGEYLRLGVNEANGPLADLFRAPPPFKGALDLISTDQILNAELLEEVRSG